MQVPATAGPTAERELAAGPGRNKQQAGGGVGRGGADAQAQDYQQGCDLLAVHAHARPHHAQVVKPPEGWLAVLRPEAHIAEAAGCTLQAYGL